VKVDALLRDRDLWQISALARLAEDVGFDGLHTVRAFGPLVVAAEQTSRLRLGTLAAAWRSARAAPDLQEYSRGRFVLGLGVLPVDAAGEALHAVRAHAPAVRGLVPPPRHPYGPPKVYLPAVRPELAELAGEAADGLLLGLSSSRYLQETTVPAVERGLRRSGRTWADIEVVAPGLVVTGADPAAWERSEAAVRAAIASYAAVPAYRPVFEAHGWDPGGQIDDAMVAAFAVRGVPKEIPESLVSRYGSVCRRVMLGVPFRRDPGTWAAIVARIHELTSEPVPS
jgi:alkanesulfonate monooxygenase SsuD/methylene tetrahydromethanopterin reductase-like flavin-dependent oxidoreductase (luciferase family)